jgi:hypothetical protein
MEKGNLAKAPQWWRHLRRFKRTFWRRNRQAERREIEAERDAEPRVDRSSRLR